MKILIFDPLILGHHLEYIHHLYMMAIERPHDSFIFAVHKDFENRQIIMTWPKAENVIFDTIPEIKKQKSNSIIEMLKTSWITCEQLKMFVNKYQIDRVFTNNIISLVPFAPIFLGKHVSVSGIIYHIYLYKLDEISWLQKALNKFKYHIMSCSKVFRNVLVLNDQGSADVFNLEYKCKKFVGLPDPFIPITTEGLFDFRKENNIPSSAIIFAHFGGLQKRKGTIDIVKSLNLLDEKDRKNYWFVFAGLIKDDMKESFYETLFKICRDSGRHFNIIIKDEFCSYEYLASLCQACDAILAPYHETDLSSGMFGYASQFRKPLIAPSQGLVGKIMRQYNLGVCIDSINENTLYEAYSNISSLNYSVSQDYIEENNVERFQEIIAKYLCEE